MNKVWIVGVFFSLLITLNAKESLGKLTNWEPLEREVYIIFQIDGKEISFFAPYEDEKILDVLSSHRDEFSLVKYSIRPDNGAEILGNVYFNNGDILLGGKGKPTNYYEKYEKACDNGESQKCYELALANAGFLEAPGYYNKACKGGHAQACYELAGIYELGNRAVQKDVKLANKYYSSACRNGVSEACGASKELERGYRIASKGRLHMKGFSSDMTFKEACQRLSKMKQEKSDTFRFSSGGSSCFLENKGRLRLASISGGDNEYTIGLTGGMVEKLFSITNMTHAEFAQSFVDNYDWIDSFDTVYYPSGGIRSYFRRNGAYGWGIGLTPYFYITIGIFAPIGAKFD